MPDHLLFDVHQVAVDLNTWELPGPTQRRITCRNCGQVVRDGREIVKDDRVLCRPCSGKGYFRVLQNVSQL